MNQPPKMAAPARFSWLASAMARRIGGACVVLLSFLLVWFSANRLSSTRQEVANLSSQAARLSGEIDLMRAQWPDSRTQSVHTRFPAAEARLFQGSPALAEWMRAANARAIPLALDTEFEFMGIRTQQLDQPIAIMQTRLSVHPNPDATSPRPSYQRLLEFSRFLTEHTQRLDIVELTVTGTSNSVGSASLVLDLWADHRPALSP